MSIEIYIFKYEKWSLFEWFFEYMTLSTSKIILLNDIFCLSKSIINILL
jgi:hypothetical protein